ncbi:MAG: flavin reductase family protein [Spirochaetes bacterium]|nr:MAG: flavin reductase family protein [Spirochaetota bacterium]
MEFKRRIIEMAKFVLPVYNVWDGRAFLLAVGDFKSGDFNVMTIGWGSMGRMWSKPYVAVVIRPTRYTYGFMEKYDNFTVSLLPDSFKDILTYCGTYSGRDVDKIKETGLTPIKSNKVSSPGFDEAELIIECKKIYFDDYKPSNFLKASIHSKYPLKDYHRLYYGEIIEVNGIKAYIGK